jgi:hypothetical protein
MPEGFVVVEHEDGSLSAFRETFPRDSYADVYAWGEDFWLAFMERPKILRWIAKLAMGRYAFRELYGIREAVNKRIDLESFFFNLGYCLKDMDYHKDKTTISPIRK